MFRLETISNRRTNGAWHDGLSRVTVEIRQELIFHFLNRYLVGFSIEKTDNPLKPGIGVGRLKKRPEWRYLKRADSEEHYGQR